MNRNLAMYLTRLVAIQQATRMLACYNVHFYEEMRMLRAALKTPKSMLPKKRYVPTITMTPKDRVKYDEAWNRYNLTRRQ